METIAHTITNEIIAIIIGIIGASKDSVIV